MSFLFREKGEMYDHLPDPPYIERYTTRLAVYWFLVAHHQVHAGPYRFPTQAEFAAAVGIAEGAVSRLKQAHQAGEVPWLYFGEDYVSLFPLFANDSND